MDTQVKREVTDEGMMNIHLLWSYSCQGPIHSCYGHKLLRAYSCGGYTAVTDVQLS